ncbi:hypothetical protein LZP97_26705 (plasmid) [Rhodococcus sp. DMF-1]|uniref:hypothetical protein n=1 Tax=Rhodococcus sp. DMF-1 TaxID=2907624 RepID=UPI001F38DF4E|nr:hypothetical protein [Rhodococcus sp. DMF-1]UIR39671.1 hypothetical protein LZP97_26705 [Rhodococcus sp. DMF-1]
MTEGSRGGRRREYASDADRVRAWRQRQKERARAERLAAAAPTDPVAAVSTLAEAVPLLRQETQAALARLTEVAASITAATALLADPAALDAHLRRVHADADKVRADAGARSPACGRNSTPPATSAPTPRRPRPPRSRRPTTPPRS